MPVFTNVNANTNRPEAQAENLKQIQQMAADFSEKYSNAMKREVQRLKELGKKKEDGSFDYLNYGLSENTSDEMLFSLIASWHMQHGIEPEDLLADDELAEPDRPLNGDDPSFKKSGNCYSFLREMGMEEHMNLMRGTGGREIFRKTIEDRVRALDGTFTVVAESQIPLPPGGNLEPDTFFREAARANVLYDISKGERLFTGYEVHMSDKDMNNLKINLTPDEIKEIRDHAMENARAGLSSKIRYNNPVRILGRNEEIARACASVFNNLIMIFAQPAFAGESEPMRELDDYGDINVDALEKYYNRADEWGTSMTFYQLADDANKEKREKWSAITDMERRQPRHQTLIALFGVHRPVNNFADMEPSKLLSFATGRQIQNPDEAKAALDSLYINGKCLREMSVEDAAGALKSSLYADSPDVAARKGADGFEPIDPVHGITRTGIVFSGQAKYDLERKLEHDREYIRLLNNFSMENAGDIKAVKAPSMNSNMDPIEYLSRVTDMEIDIRNPETVRRALQSIYINGKNLSDVLVLEPASENLGAFYNAVKTVLDGRDDSFVTIMNRNSVTPDPRAVIPGENANIPWIRDKITSSIGFVKNYHERMSHAADEAFARQQQRIIHNNAMFKPAEKPPLIISHLVNSGRGAFAIPSIYMLSQGYKLEEVLGDDPAFDVEKQEIGKQFYELFACRKDAAGKYLPPDDPANIKHYRENVEPVLKQMAETVAGLKITDADICDSDSLDKLNMLRTYCGEVVESFMSESFVSGMGDNPLYDLDYLWAPLYSSSNVFRRYLEDRLDYLSTDIYRTDGRIFRNDDEMLQKAIFREAVYHYPGDSKAFNDVPLGVLPISELTALQNVYEMEFLDPYSNPAFQVLDHDRYESYKKSSPAEFLQDMGRTNEDTVSKYSQVLNKFAERGRTLNSLDADTYKAEIKKLTYAGSTGAVFAKDAQTELSYTDLYEYLHADGLSLMSRLAGFPLRENSSKEEISFALEKIYINDKSLKEFFPLGDNPDFDALKNVNRQLKDICTRVFDTGQSDTAILIKDKDNTFMPVTVDYVEEPAPVELLSEGDEETLQQNRADYEKYTLLKYAFDTKEAKKELAKASTAFANALTKHMNNEKLDNEDQKALADNGFRPVTRIEQGDIREIFSAINGKPGYRPESGDLIKAADKLYINGKSFYDYFGINRNDPINLEVKISAAQINGISFNSLLENPNAARLVMIKNDNGSFSPVMLAPKHMPNAEPVEPLTFGQRLVMSRAEKEKHNRALEEYRRIVAENDVENTNAKNRAIEEYNEAARVYVRALNGQSLTNTEMNTLNKTVQLGQHDQSVSMDKRPGFPNAKQYGVKSPKSMNFNSLNAPSGPDAQNRSDNIKTSKRVTIQAPPVNSGMTPAEYLSRVTGITIDEENSGTVRHALQSIYINGKNLSDTLGLEPTAGNLERFNEAVKAAFDVHNDSFITIMNRDSIVPNPRAVIPPGDIKSFAVRKKTEQSVEFANNYHENMSRAAAEASKRRMEINAYNTALFQSAGTPPLIIPALANPSGMPFALPSLYMLSQGYPVEAVFGDDRRYDDEKKYMGDLFYETFSCRKDEDGNYLPPDHPENIKHYREKVIPALKGMVEAVSGMKLQYADINDRDNLDRLNMLDTCYNSVLSLASEDLLRHMQDTERLMVSTAAGCQIYGFYIGSILRYIQSDTYLSDGENFDDFVFEHAVTPEAIFHYQGDPKAFDSLPVAAFPVTEGFKAFIHDYYNVVLGYTTESFSPMTAEQYELYRAGNPAEFLTSIVNVGDDAVFAASQAFNRFAERGKALNKLELVNPDAYQEELRRLTYAGSLGTLNSDSVILSYEALYDGQHAEDGLGLISTLAGFPLGANPSREEINIALGKIYINDKSLRELIPLGNNPDLNALKDVNEVLRNTITNIYDIGQLKAGILIKDKDNNFKPISVVYTSPKPVKLLSRDDVKPEGYDPGQAAPEEKARIEAEIDRKLTKNTADYERYAACKKAYDESNERTELVRTSMEFASSLARHMNNQKLDEKDEKSLADNGFRISTRINPENGHDIFSSINGKNDELPEEEIIKTADKLYINGRSFYEYFDIARDHVPDGTLAQRIRESGLENLIDNPSAARLVIIRSGDGSITPVTRTPVPDTVEKADEKKRAVEEYNETVRVYARALNGQILTKTEVDSLNKAVQLSRLDQKISDNKKLNFPHAEQYGVKFRKSINLNSLAASSEVTMHHAAHNTRRHDAGRTDQQMPHARSHAPK